MAQCKSSFPNHLVNGMILQASICLIFPIQEWAPEKLVGYVDANPNTQVPNWRDECRVYSGERSHVQRGKRFLLHGYTPTQTNRP